VDWLPRILKECMIEGAHAKELPIIRSFGS
jgi:hypothetical protein